MEIQQKTMTATDKANYEAELAQLKIDKKEVIQQIADARALGDLSENDEYKQAKDREARVNGRILELEEMLKTYILVEDVVSNGDTVNINSVVKIYDFEFEEEDTFTIVGVTETDPNKGFISTESPIGKALYGAKPGDIVVAKTPGGDVKMEIREISAR